MAIAAVGTDELLTPAATASSRTSEQAAGWACRERVARPPELAEQLSWFNPGVLWRSRNDVLARLLADPVAGRRASYVAGLQDRDLAVDVPRTDALSFLLLGDTGEGDWSQYAVPRPLLTQAAGTDFLFVCSDVLYPVGDVEDYQRKFYRPYRDYRGPIYAIPGNHDWYDDLQGFLWHLCGRRSFPDEGGRAPQGWLRAVTTREGWARLLWRRPSPPSPGTAAAAPQRPPTGQRSPYYVVDTPFLRLVAIDTGIRGCLDGPQGDWLVRVSRDPRPKVLLTGSPVWVDGEHLPRPIEGGTQGFASVSAVVADPRHGYVAVISGDVHNYQHYPVREDGRVVHHVVSGGGGAFMHATHTIGSLDAGAVPGVTEDDFRCYPLRRDSLAVYSSVLDRTLRRHWPGMPRLALTPDEAALFLRRRLGVAPLPTRPARADGLSGRARAVAALLLLAGGGKAFHRWLSPFLDWDEPPFFKQFLRVDADAEQLRIRCFGVTGCPEDDAHPTLEDEIRIPLGVRELA